MEKIFNHKSFNYFVWTPLGSRLTYKYIFAFKFTFRSQQPDNVLIICHRCGKHRWQIFRRYCSYQCKLTPVSLTPAANLPPVSTTLAKLVAKFTAGVVDTGDNFAAGVIYTGNLRAADEAVLNIQ
jgi:hypothetical protein